MKYDSSILSGVPAHFKTGFSRFVISLPVGTTFRAWESDDAYPYDVICRKISPSYVRILASYSESATESEAGDRVAVDVIRNDGHVQVLLDDDEVDRMVTIIMLGGRLPEPPEPQLFFTD